MRVAVIIPTTDGPAPILKLSRLSQAPRSVLRVQDDYRPLPPSSRYHAFIQPGGPLAERIGLKGGQYELRLGAAVETGRSWELPAAIAHWAQTAGHCLDPETADLVVWATGALDNDLSVLVRDYHLRPKLERSEGLLKEWRDRGVAVLLLLPEDVTLEAALTSSLVTVRRVRDLAEALTAIDETRPSGQDDGPEISTPQSARRRQVLISGAAVLLLSMMLWASAELPLTGPTNDLEEIDAARSEAPETLEVARSPHLEGAAADPARDPAAAGPLADLQRSMDTASALNDASALLAGALDVVLPKIVLQQAPDGSNCRSVLFGETAPQRVELVADEGRVRAIADGDLCGLGLYLPESATAAADILLPPVITDLMLPSDRQVRFSLAPGEERLFRLRAQVPARIEADIVMRRSGHDPGDMRVIIETPQ